jgi:hypothetical protein
MPILHVSQLASALGLPPPAGGEAAGLAWDLASVLDSWCDHLVELEWELLVTPTPSRGRSLRNLTVNTFHPVELLPAAWEAGRFDWDPDGDEEREHALAGPTELNEYAARIAAAWTDFLLRVGDELAAHDPQVASPRGELAFSDLLDSQRWHAAYHYRQLVEFLRTSGVAVQGALGLDAMGGLELPADVFC